MLAQSVERVTLNIYYGRIKVITRLGVRAPRRALFFWMRLKLLGVTLDCELKSQEHLKGAISKANKVMGIILSSNV